MIPISSARRDVRANDCTWRITDVARNIWAGQCCTTTHFFAIGGPLQNGWKECPYCGGYLLEFAHA
jgi:hypothetical protein